MTWTKLPLEPSKLAFAISFALLGFTPVKAQPVNPVILVQRLTSNPTGELVFEQTPPDQGTPEGTEAGGQGSRYRVEPKGEKTTEFNLYSLNYDLDKVAS